MSGPAVRTSTARVITVLREPATRELNRVSNGALQDIERLGFLAGPRDKLVRSHQNRASLVFLPPIRRRIADHLQRDAKFCGGVLEGRCCLARAKVDQRETAPQF